MDNTMKRSATYLLGVLLLLAAGSCSVQKKCKAPQLDMPAEIVAGQSDTLTLSDRKWWEVYTDTTLCRLIGRTLDRNRNMLSAEARIRQLEELYRVSKAARLPSLGGLAAADYETNDYYGEAHKGDAEFDVKATLSWEADLWGNLRWAKRKGAAEYLASVEAARAMQMTLVAEVATAYFELVALDHELGVVRRTVETREESVRQAKLRFEGGLTSETAYQQAKVELAVGGVYGAARFGQGPGDLPVGRVAGRVDDSPGFGQKLFQFVTGGRGLACEGEEERAKKSEELFHSAWNFKVAGCRVCRRSSPPQPVAGFRSGLWRASARCPAAGPRRGG